MGKKIEVDFGLDVATTDQLEAVRRRLEDVVRRHNAVCEDVATNRTNVADHEREIALSKKRIEALEGAVKNLQQWVADRALEKYTQPAVPATHVAPPEPTVTTSACQGKPDVLLGLSRRQAEVLRILLGSIGGQHPLRDHFVSPLFKALADVTGPARNIPGLKHGWERSLTMLYEESLYAPAPTDSPV